MRAPRAGCGRARGCRPSLELDPCRDSGQPYPQVSELLPEQSSKRSPASRGARRPRGSSPQPLTCSAKGTLPSIAATADARRSSSRQSRAIAGRRPPGRARAEAAGQGGRRVPGRRCATRGWLLRILSRSRWDWTSRSAAWAWAGVCVRGAVRARGDVGVHVCVYVYGRGGCVRAYVRERARESEPGRARESVCVLVSHCKLPRSLREDGAGQTDGGWSGIPHHSSLPTPNTSCPIKESNLQNSAVQSGASTSLHWHC